MHEHLQAWLDALVRAPQWAGLALLGLAVAITLLGRHGQRPLNAALLASAAVGLSLFALRGLHDWIPGIVAIISGALLGCFGFVALAWGTALTLAVILGGGSALLAHKLHFWWPAALALPAAIGLFLGVRHHRRLSIFLPPLFSALFLAAGAAIAFAPHARGAILWPLNDVIWALGLFLLLLGPLVALSMERDHRRRKRLLARTKQMDDDDLEKQLKSRQDDFERAFQEKSGG